MLDPTTKRRKVDIGLCGVKLGVEMLRGGSTAGADDAVAVDDGSVNDTAVEVDVEEVLNIPLKTVSDSVGNRAVLPYAAGHFGFY